MSDTESSESDQLDENQELIQLTGQSITDLLEFARNNQSKIDEIIDYETRNAGSHLNYYYINASMSNDAISFLKMKYALSGDLSCLSSRLDEYFRDLADDAKYKNERKVIFTMSHIKKWFKDMN